MKGCEPNKAHWKFINRAGLVDSRRIVTAARYDSMPIRRMVQMTSSSHVIMLTNGRKRKSVLVLDSGHVVVTPLDLDELMEWLDRGAG